MEVLTLPPALPTPDEESVAIFSCQPTFVSAPPSGFEDSPTEPTTVEGLDHKRPAKLGRTGTGTCVTVVELVTQTGVFGTTKRRMD